MRYEWLVGVLVSVAVAGCTSSGPVGNPLVRGVEWFSYLNGDDIRQACQPGSPDRYRLVYNAVYTEQVRTYDVVGSTANGGRLSMRAIGRNNFSNTTLDDLLRSFTGNSAEATLGGQQVVQLSNALAASGFDRPAPDGTFLRSDGFYWVVSACRGGTFHFNAWMGPEGFEQLQFVGLLRGWDTTGKPFNEVRQQALGPFRSDTSHGSPVDGQQFLLQVGPNGLRHI